MEGVDISPIGSERAKALTGDGEDIIATSFSTASISFGDSQCPDETEARGKSPTRAVKLSCSAGAKAPTRDGEA